MINTPAAPPGVRHREPTTSARARAVKFAIAAMRERLGEPQELRDTARAALMSPFHFHRVFQTMTAATPGRFLTALRMSEAKRMLIETDLSATEISIAVGYSSFGTFTSQFTKLVGMPPGRFRTCAAPVADMPVRLLLDQLTAQSTPGRPGVRGWVGGRPDRSPGIAIVGLFPSSIAQERPVACTFIEPPGPVMLPDVPRNGMYAALAVSVSVEATVWQVLTEHPAAGMCVGAADGPIEVLDSAASLEFWISLRRPAITDPPILTAFPLLAGTAKLPKRRGRVG